MADEAFALSPIHARASLPTDADYDAICEAFMETSRGRWFLTEYAKRNRNTDTRMVLEAIERLENNLASQKHAQAEAQAQMQAEAKAAQAQPEPEPKIDLWPELAKAFTRTRIEIAQRLVHESNEDAYETIRASVETLRSICWALRERGFDSRICDFLDIQVKAITDGYTGLLAESSVATGVEEEILAVFDALFAQVEGLTKSGDAETEALDAVVDAVADAMNEDDSVALVADDTADAVMPDPEPEAVIETAQPIEAAPAEIAATVEVIPAPDTEAAFRQIYGDDGDIEFIDAGMPEAPAAATPTEPEINRQRLYEAKVEPYRTAPIAQPQAAVIDDIEIVDAAPAGPAPLARSPVDAPGPPAAMPQPAPIEPPKAQQPEAPARAPVEQMQAPASQSSLGQALLASGVVQNPAGRSDPLAPFRRMSQAEKVAFFT